MSIRPCGLELIEKYFPSLRGVKMLELGDQMWLHFNDRSGHVKPWFQSQGALHVSIDRNGQGGSLPIDLCKETFYHPGFFDLVTDFGTMEHIENQYEGWKNVHNWTRLGGIQIHMVPASKNLCPQWHWENHGLWFLNPDFFERLFKQLNYAILECYVLEWIGETVAVVRKDANIPFVSKDDFDRLPVLPGGGGLGNMSH